MLDKFKGRQQMKKQLASSSLRVDCNIGTVYHDECLYRVESKQKLSHVENALKVLIGSN